MKKGNLIQKFVNVVDDIVLAILWYEALPTPPPFFSLKDSLNQINLKKVHSFEGYFQMTSIYIQSFKI